MAARVERKSVQWEVAEQPRGRDRIREDGIRVRSRSAVVVRFQEVKQAPSDDPCKLIDEAYGFLTTPLVHSHTDADYTRKVNEKIGKISEFRGCLYSLYWVKSRDSEQKKLGEAYLEKLQVVCKKFLRNYKAIEMPHLPDPTEKEAVQIEFQTRYKHSSNLRDSKVWQCVADILVLAEDYEAQKANPPKSLATRVRRAVYSP
ncbi:MAG TPA: hypothetical protein VLF94_08455 [Chlamydiales bacterium]|nr:hypothetical protein [Chlamydiales bacterium]